MKLSNLLLHVLPAFAVIGTASGDTFCDVTFQVTDVPDYISSLSYELPGTVTPIALGEFGTTCSTDTFYQVYLGEIDIDLYGFTEQPSHLVYDFTTGGSNSLAFAFEQSFVDTCESVGSIVYTVNFNTGHPDA